MRIEHDARPRVSVFRGGRRAAAGLRPYECGSRRLGGRQDEMTQCVEWYIAVYLTCVGTRSGLC